MKVNEIFFSLQGEGKWTGLPNVFIRTAGCNLRCSYCDTKYAYFNGKEMRVDDILKKIRNYPCKYLCITGGEPLLQKDIHELIEKAGGINIAQVAGEGYPTLTLEEVIAANPQVIIANVEEYEGGDISFQFIFDEPRLGGLDALVNGRVYGINADLTNQPIPRIVDGLELMAKMIHPELFGSVE